jgi:hypothetical protein
MISRSPRRKLTPQRGLRPRNRVIDPISGLSAFLVPLWRPAQFGVSTQLSIS